ncbi:hypothetical protein DDB_G0288987 [Dictyostelium discoideum AX4]|uniref:Uncharacterized protein n=1 Tax=Dictyostelium discoideum TaxID=44689 RepID=Q54I59_DICDI|nr:hypothetical protein DDB_G0288987 [Dictyostelium discoideum AX4]EAL62948.1 hypothetical protein DDB_G0288987 [Dictyostelium discoideum AX4]|eukprot:XP_636451.1 hypothetical protein DDB_G0288987 [Dictyostelium discoideum AX4]
MIKFLKFSLLLILITLSFHINNVVCMYCSPIEMDCSKSKPCNFNQKSIWPTNKVPTNETCDLLKFSGENSYYVIDKNINIPNIDLLNGVTVHFKISNDNSTQSLDQLNIQNLKVNGANLIIELNNYNNNKNNNNNNNDNSKIGLIKQLQCEIDNSTINIINSEIKFQIIDLNTEAITVNVENSKLQLIGSGNESDEKFRFEPRLTLKSTIMDIEFMSIINDPTCYFSNGIKSYSHDSSVSIKGNCVLHKESEFVDLSISGVGFTIAESSNVIVNGKFNSDPEDGAFKIESKSSIRFQAPIDNKDEENDSDDDDSSTFILNKNLKVGNIKLLNSENSQIIIGSDKEVDNFEFINVEISNIIGGKIQLENSVREKITLSNLENTIIQTDIGNQIIIKNSIITSITDRGSNGNSSDSSTSLTFRNENSIVKGIDISKSLVYIDSESTVTFMNDSMVRINDQHSKMDIRGDLIFKSNSSLLMDRNKNARLTLFNGAMITLDNSTIQCYNLTLNGGVLSVVGGAQSTLDLSDSLLLNGNATLLISNINSDLLLNKLVVKGDLKIYSKQSLIRFDRLGRISPHLLIDGDCLFNGDLEIYFNPNIEYHSEYHILKCESGRYSNQFISTKIFLNNSLISSSSYQIEQTDAIYLITEEIEEDEVEKTLNGWTLFTVICITAFAVLIISFYLFYKKKFRKQNNHYLPVELTEIDNNNNN